jgi:solute carrier family 50 protein (sugar transporter)
MVHRRTFIAIRTNGSVGEFSPIPYLAALLNCAVWVLYGLVHPNSTPVVIISGIGVVIELVYMAFFVYYSAGVVHRNVFLSLAAELIFVGSVAALVLSLVHSQEGKSMALGMVGVGTSIFMYVSPLSTMVRRSPSVSLLYMLMQHMYAIAEGSDFVHT